MWRASATTAVVVALFFAGQPPTKVAIVIDGLLLVTRRVRSERIFAQIDWPLLLMFAGLFIIVAGAERSLLESDAVAAAGRLQLDCLPVLSALTAILSKFDQQRAGGGGTETVRRELAQSRPGLADGSDGSTLAGNLTVLGSIANLIVVQRAAAGGITIGVWDCCRVGVPLTLLTLLIGTIWLRI